MKLRQSYLIIVVLIVAVVVFFGNQLFFRLVPGERAIIFRPFTSGLDTENIYKPGFHIKAPWNNIYAYNVKEQKSEETMDVLDKNGLSVNMDVSVRFNPLYDKIGFLHEQFGVNYVHQLIIPEVRSSVRQVAGRYTAEEIYSTKRQEVETAIIAETKEILKANFIDMRALLIRSINLPAQIKTAIENKLQQQQEALAYQFRLDKERSEAERKKIEAEGIASYNNTINASLTDKILQQRGIEATIQLSESENAKIVVVGNKDGLPLILGNN